MELDNLKEESLLELPTGGAIVEANHDRYRRDAIGHEKYAQLATLATNFLEGTQYTQEEITAFKDQGRPYLTKNKIAPLHRLMMGFMEENNYEIKFLPGNDGTGSQEIADTLSATHKQVEESNDAEWKDTDVFQDGITTGRGFLDQRISFVYNKMGDIKQSVLNPLEVLIDADATTYDPNDEDGGWDHWEYNRWMSISDIYTLYGPMAFRKIGDMKRSIPLLDGDYYGTSRAYDSPGAGFGLDQDMRLDYEWTNFVTTQYSDFFLQNRRLIRVIDCQHKVLKRCNYFVDTETGQQKVIPEGWDEAKIRRVMQFVTERQLPVSIETGIKKRIRWTITAADRLIWDEWSPYDQYTIIPYFPYFRRGATRGMIDDLIDPQRELNKRSSALLHIVMATANSGWMWEEGALSEDMETALEEEGARPGIHLKYRMGYNAPARIEPAALPSNVKILEDQATVDLREISGINESSLGQKDPTANSGRAVLAKQKQAVIGAQTYFKNFSRYRQIKGKNQLSLIQNFYTEPRLIRSRAAEKGDQMLWINSRDAAGEIVNNVAFGRYNVTVAEAPVSASFMQGQFQEMLELIEKGAPIPWDIAIKLSSAPNKEEILQRMREERQLQEESIRMQTLAGKASMGIPPDMPTPPITVDGGPAVIQAQPPGAGIPPTAIPGGPAAAPMLPPPMRGGGSPIPAGPDAGAIPQGGGDIASLVAMLGQLNQTLQRPRDLKRDPATQAIIGFQ
jgi:hypothetical protein